MQGLQRGLVLQGRHRAVLLLQLATLLALLPLDSLPLVFRQHLLVLNPQLPPLNIQLVHPVNDLSRLIGTREVGKGEATEHSVVEMVVESVGLWQVHFHHDGLQDLLADVERDILDDNGGGYQVVLLVVVRLATLGEHVRLGSELIHAVHHLAVRDALGSVDGLARGLKTNAGMTGWVRLLHPVLLGVRVSGISEKRQRRSA